MSSDDQKWEMVKKSKKGKNLEKKREAHTEQRRLNAQLPKLEEILPAAQYRSLIGADKKPASSNGSPASTSASASATSAHESVKPSLANNNKNKGRRNLHNRKQQRIQEQQQQQEKPKQLIRQCQQQEQQVPLWTVNKKEQLKGGLSDITSDAFETNLKHLQYIYPGSELLWLKGIATFLTPTVPYNSDPIFIGQPFEYPSNLLPRPVNSRLEQMLGEIGEANLCYFYPNLLETTVIEVNKNSPSVIGYKVLLQTIVKNWPKACSTNFERICRLRNSYQDPDNVLTILWATAQGGYYNVDEGIKVWQNIMLPMIEISDYSSFIVKYINTIWCRKIKPPCLDMNQTDFFVFYDSLRSKYYGLPNDLKDSLSKSAELYLISYIYNKPRNASNIFLHLLRYIKDIEKSVIELDACILCLTHFEVCIRTWRNNYKTHMFESLILFNYITEVECRRKASDLLSIKSFGELLLEIYEYLYNEMLMREEYWFSTSQPKRNKSNGNGANNQKKKCGCCRWTLGSLFLLALIAGALTYDTQVNGKGVFERSATGKVLKQAGLLPYVETAWYKTMSISARGYKWAEVHVPPYAKPAGKLACDLFKLTRNTACNVFAALSDFVKAKLPVASQFLEQYVPGLPQQIENVSLTVKNIVVDATGKIVVFFKTQVLVGRLSPESLSQALNQTQNLALEYLNLFHKKVDAYAKLK